MKMFSRNLLQSALPLQGALLLRGALFVAIGMAAVEARAAPFLAPGAPGDGAWRIVPAKDFMRGVIDLFGDQDNYVHDDHYDAQHYRDTTSRKDRIRDYYMMQNQAQMDYLRHQKDMQKRMIKQQRGW